MGGLKRRTRAIAIGIAIVLCAGACLAGFFLWARASGLGRLLRAYFLIKTQFLGRAETATLVEGALKGMVESLGDPYSTYLGRDAYRELNLQIEGTFGGIGVELDVDSSRRLVVVAPLPGTPAAAAGIRSGDVVVAINGREAAGLDLAAAARLLRGRPGTPVSLRVWREQEKRYLDFHLVRAQIVIPAVVGRVLEGVPRIGYVRILQFNRASTLPQLREQLALFERKGCRGLVLDLRGNPGGDLEAAVDVAGCFLGNKPVVRIVRRGGREEVWYARPAGTPTSLPLAVLVDGGSASAAEIVAGALKDAGRGVLVGTRTFGKGLVQTVFGLGAGTGMKLTTDKYLTPKGRDIHGKGILPDVVVPQPPGSREDLQLEKAVELLKKELARGEERNAVSVA